MIVRERPVRHYDITAATAPAPPVFVIPKFRDDDERGPGMGGHFHFDKGGPGGGGGFGLAA